VLGVLFFTSPFGRGRRVAPGEGLRSSDGEGARPLKGIRCNVIAPGFMDTPMGRDASRWRSDRALTVPFGRQGTGWEVAYAALFLILNESSYINAHTLFLDGGHLGGIVRG
jgi:NAD(P)-dependent dehydrogenase (short-subunit alcohol dehydrogenase family)